MRKDEFTSDGIHENIQFNEYRSAEFWTAYWARRTRMALVKEKLAPYLVVLGAVVAFLAIGYMESAL